MGADGVLTPDDGAVTPVKGGFYVLICLDENGVEVRNELVTYNPADPVPGTAAPADPSAFAASVAVQLRAQVPVVSTSPPKERSQLVGVQTWFWVDGWAERSVDGEAGGFSIRVSGRPAALIIDPGDGAGRQVTCTAATAVPWVKGGPHESDCGYTYFRRSAGEPGGTFGARARIRYDDVRWEARDPGGGVVAAGVLPPITSDDAVVPLVVRDAQAVIR